MTFRTFLFSFFFLCIPAFSSPLEKYYQYLDEYGDAFAKKGSFRQGEMQVIANLDEALFAQDQYLHFFLKRGMEPSIAEQRSQLGIIAEDSRWMWIRDPLILPNGEMTGYNRFMPKSTLKGDLPVSVLALNENKEVLVLVIFRHATRDWEIEAPRGGCNSNETSLEAAARELREETGYEPKSLEFLTTIATDSGILSNSLNLFVATGLEQKNIEREDEEAIIECLFLSKNELKEAFSKGYLDLCIKDQKIRAYCRDSFLASSLLIAEYKNLL